MNAWVLSNEPIKFVSIIITSRGSGHMMASVLLGRKYSIQCAGLLVNFAPCSKQQRFQGDGGRFDALSHLRTWPIQNRHTYSIHTYTYLYIHIDTFSCDTCSCIHIQTIHTHTIMIHTWYIWCIQICTYTCVYMHIQALQTWRCSALRWYQEV